MRLRLVALLGVLVVGVAATSVAIVPPKPSCTPIAQCVEDLLPGNVGPDPDKIPAVVVFDVPGILTVSHVDLTTAPITKVQSLPATVSRYDSADSTVAAATIATPAIAGYHSGTVTTGATLGTTAPSNTQYACIYYNKNDWFFAGEPVTTNGSDNVNQWRWQFSPYTQYYARVVAGKWTWQEEICSVGGADGQNGYRTLYNASIMAATSNNGSRRVGLANDTGSDSRASASINVSAKWGPVTVGASIPTYSGGSLYGQYGKPRYRSSVDRWYQTESFAGWTASCTWNRSCGSPNMQSQVHHGLFEFYHGDYNYSFPLDAQWNIYCANPYGAGCG